MARLKSKDKAGFEVSFESPEHAAKAMRVLKTREISDRASLKLKVSGSKLVASVEGSGFSALRARSVSFLRELKLVFDAISLAKQKKR